MTIKDCLNRAADESPDGVALRYKHDGNWRITTFSDLRKQAWHVSEMLACLNVQPGTSVVADGVSE